MKRKRVMLYQGLISEDGTLATLKTVDISFGIIDL
jgi:hypothetical protein